MRSRRSRPRGTSTGPERPFLRAGCAGSGLSLLSRCAVRALHRAPLSHRLPEARARGSRVGHLGRRAGPRRRGSRRLDRAAHGVSGPDSREALEEHAPPPRHAGGRGILPGRRGRRGRNREGTRSPVDRPGRRGKGMDHRHARQVRSARPVSRLRRERLLRAERGSPRRSRASSRSDPAPGRGSSRAEPRSRRSDRSRSRSTSRWFRSRGSPRDRRPRTFGCLSRTRGRLRAPRTACRRSRCVSIPRTPLRGRRGTSRLVSDARPRCGAGATSTSGSRSRCGWRRC